MQYSKKYQKKSFRILGIFAEYQKYFFMT